MIKKIINKYIKIFVLFRQKEYIFQEILNSFSVDLCRNYLLTIVSFHNSLMKAP